MTTYDPQPRRRTPWWPYAAVALVVLAGAGWFAGVVLGGQDSAKDSPGGGVTLEQVQAYASSAAALPRCADLFKAGQKIDGDKAKGGCLDPDGTAILGGGRRCGDGRYLFNMDADSGAPIGYGFSGDVYHVTKTAVADDPGFAKAYEACAG